MPTKNSGEKKTPITSKIGEKNSARKTKQFSSVRMKKDKRYEKRDGKNILPYTVTPPVSVVPKEEKTPQIAPERNAERLETNFVMNYQDLLNGSASHKWSDFQIPDLPKHRIDHIYNSKSGILCTCGAGPFRTMALWCNHAAGRKLNLGQTKINRRTVR